ncbi:MAG TPA: hypothetical protein VK978_02575 [Candidatus Saccharimonadales bacterium]|nr:hypothetical protein [Candidatus Saccharimonadales bacterium]
MAKKQQITDAHIHLLSSLVATLPWLAHEANPDKRVLLIPLRWGLPTWEEVIEWPVGVQRILVLINLFAVPSFFISFSGPMVSHMLSGPKEGSSVYEWLLVSALTPVLVYCVIISGINAVKLAVVLDKRESK